MSTVWTMEYGGTEKTLKLWGIDEKSLNRRLASQSEDIVSFNTATDIDVTPAFPYRSKLTFYQTVGGIKTQWFVGWVTATPLSGNAKSERHRYTVSGPWWWLTQLVFQQIWYAATDPENPASSIVGGYKSRVLLNQGFNGTKLTTRQQITAIVDYLRDTATNEGIDLPMQNGGDYPIVNIPINEVLDTTCAECLRSQLRWAPDAITWFDYETSPPTLHIQKRSEMDAVNIPFSDNVVVEHNIAPREDIKVDAVVLKFEQTNFTNGNQWVYTTTQAFPVGADERVFGALVQTINLQGYSASEVKSTVTSEVWSPTDVAWLKKKVPALADPNVISGSIVATPIRLLYPDGTSYNYETSSGVAPSLLYDLKTGVLADGFTLSNGTLVQAKEYTLLLNLRYTKNNETDVPQDKFDGKPTSIKFTATNATSAQYAAIQSYQAGDEIPTGLAESLYDGLNELQYDGSILIKKAELEDDISMGNVLNLTGGRVAWETMRAQVQSISETPATGEKVVSFGVARYLTAGDFISLLRVNRERRSFTAPNTIDTGRASGSSNNIGDNTGKENSGFGGGGRKAGVVRDATEKNFHEVDAANGVLRMKHYGVDKARPDYAQETVKNGSEINVDLVDLNGKRIAVKNLTVIDVNDVETVYKIIAEDDIDIESGGSGLPVWL